MSSSGLGEVISKLYIPKVLVPGGLSNYSCGYIVEDGDYLIIPVVEYCLKVRKDGTAMSIVGPSHSMADVIVSGGSVTKVYKGLVMEVGDTTVSVMLPYKTE